MIYFSTCEIWLSFIPSKGKYLQMIKREREKEGGRKGEGETYQTSQNRWTGEL